MTYDAIKKSVSEKHGHGVGPLRDELDRLSSQSKPLPSPRQSKQLDIVSQYQHLPDDIMFETLLKSDLKTIVSTCTASKATQLLCNKQFWERKFKYDDLPFIDGSKTFQDFAKQYHLVYTKKQEAIMLLDVVRYYNQDQDLTQFDIIYKPGPRHLSNLFDALLEKLIMKVNDDSILAKNAYIYISVSLHKNQWKYIMNLRNFDIYSIEHIISQEDLIQQLLEILLYDSQNCNIVDVGENTLMYHRLVKTAKRNKPIQRAYLMAYRILMDYKNK